MNDLKMHLVDELHVQSYTEICVKKQYWCEYKWDHSTARFISPVTWIWNKLTVKIRPQLLLSNSLHQPTFFHGGLLAVIWVGLGWRFMTRQGFSSPWTGCIHKTAVTHTHLCQYFLANNIFFGFIRSANMISSPFYSVNNKFTKNIIKVVSRQVRY